MRAWEIWNSNNSDNNLHLSIPLRDIPELHNAAQSQMTINIDQGHIHVMLNLIRVNKGHQFLRIIMDSYYKYYLQVISIYCK